VKYGARNQLVGESWRSRRHCDGAGEGAHSGGATMCSVMTVDSLAEMELKKGEQVHVVAKAVNVLLTKSDTALPAEGGWTTQPGVMR